MNLTTALRRAAPVLVLFAAGSLLAIFFVRLWLKHRAARPEKLIFILFFFIVVARAAIFFHDAPLLPPHGGFDADAHEEYVRFIQEKAALPLPNEGWEMNQPPLYYLIAALLSKLLGLTAGNDDAVFALRTINGVVGLLHCWLVLLCLRRLFPKNFSAHAVGLLVAGFLPANLYVTLYVTNDPLAGLLSTGAVYLALRWLESDKGDFKIVIGIGFLLGLAVLTKLTALLAVPVVLAAMGLRLFRDSSTSPVRWAGSVGLVTLVCLVTCGWHYFRVAQQIGGLPLPNSQTNLLSAWWQDPGFRTASYYFGFGLSLTSPLFSGWHSFADGIYSTLWADGLVSGASQFAARPPWNYPLMYAACWFGIIFTLLGGFGFWIFFRKFIRTLDPVAGLILGMVLASLVGIIFLTLSSPWLATVKAFYAIPALAPFGALVAAGWTGVVQRKPFLQAVLWPLLLMWVAVVIGSFWIQPGNSELWRGRALVQMAGQDFHAAEECVSHALQLNPADAVSRRILAEAQNHQGNTPGAIREYEESLRLEPDAPGALNGLAQLLASGDKPDQSRAVKLAARACEVTRYRQPGFVATLAEAQAGAGSFADAVASFDLACDLARNTGRPALLENVAVKLNNVAWSLAASPEAAQGDGKYAVQFAQRACELTHHEKTIFLGTLAAAQAEAGNFDDAVRVASQACALAAKNGEAELLQRNQELLERYRAHRPARGQ